MAGQNPSLIMSREIDSNYTGLWLQSATRIAVVVKGVVIASFDGANGLMLGYGMQDASYYYNAPGSGASVTIPVGTTQVTLDPAATIAALTLLLPTGIDGQLLRVASTKIITSLTVTAAGSDTIVTTPTTIGTAGTGFALLYRSTGTKWLTAV